MANLLDILKEYLTPSPEQAAQRGTWEAEVRANPEVMAGDPGTAPVASLLSMVPNPKNLDKFKNLLQSWMKVAPKNMPEETKQAWSYMMARYPKLMKDFPVDYVPSRQVPAYIRWATKSRLGKNVPVGATELGENIERAKDLWDFIPGLTKIRQDIWPSDILKETIDTIAHETKHGLQSVRDPKVISEYIPYKRGAKGLMDLFNFADYFLQPAERQARQVGRTATKSFDKFLKMTGF